MKRLLFALLILPFISPGQQVEKTIFNASDSAGSYYLAIPPISNKIQAVIVLISGFGPPEMMLPETKLHNVAAANDMLTVFASTNAGIYADTKVADRLTAILQHIAGKYKADTAAFVLAGYDYAGNVALRYTELAYERPADFPIHPKAVLGIDAPVDLFGLYRWCERQIKKDYHPANVGEARYIIDVLKKEIGAVNDQPGKYKQLSPINTQEDAPGNEQYLKQPAVRLYYDVDLNWQLTVRRNSLYDTRIPDGSELIKRLLLMGNTAAELVTAKQPGMISNGTRSPNALSIVDETECIQWIKKQLHIFDPVTYQPPYKLLQPAKWEIERFPIPIEFAPQIPYKGVEDVRFAPGWGEVASEEYWSYAFLWWLEGSPAIDANTLKQHLKDYYSGLVGRNITSRKIPADKIVPVNTVVNKTKTAAGDIATYTGTVHMLDYMAQRPMTLNCVVHVKNCSIPGHTAVFFEVSPQPVTHTVWKTLDTIASEFSCAQ